MCFKGLARRSQSIDPTVPIESRGKGIRKLITKRNRGISTCYSPSIVSVVDGRSMGQMSSAAVCLVEEYEECDGMSGC